MYRQILLAADGSVHSARAAEQAAYLARTSNEAVIHIVYAVDMEAIKHDVLNYWNGLDIDEKRREKLAAIEEIVKTSGAKYEIKILHGDPGPTIVKLANEDGYDLVVIGSRGLNGLQQFVLGSVSHKVAKRVNCPVLIVK
ncbi:universal stress protein [Marinicrinis lubricantis]|uniref:Universal stress protein n=1 Tax=Marinicrinis lubricantis TaxID=2086470 RepID=A0ABW1ITS1_9BACL